MLGQGLCKEHRDPRFVCWHVVTQGYSGDADWNVILASCTQIRAGFVLVHAWAGTMQRAQRPQVRVLACGDAGTLW